jgi:ADP-ribose pyrophosphatase YjhB (NUDIX family)
MKNFWDGVKGVVRKNDHMLVLVKQNGTLDLPGGRVENGESVRSALQREINEETGLKVEIHDPVEEWSFYKTPDQLIKGITLACIYLAGEVKLCAEHKRYFWAPIGSIKHLNFSRNFLRNLKFTKDSFDQSTLDVLLPPRWIASANAAESAFVPKA